MATRSAKLQQVLNRQLRDDAADTPVPLTFLEAIYSQDDPAAIVSRILGATHGLKHVQAAMRKSLSTEFFNGQATEFLTFLQTPNLRGINDGDYLNRVLIAIVDPPVFWDAFVSAFRNRQLIGKAEAAFGWLLLQLNRLPSDKSLPYLSFAQDNAIVSMLLASNDTNARASGSSINNLIKAFSSGKSIKLDQGAGGRHDNDHANFRDIAVRPTADELGSTKASFLQTSDVIDDPETADDRFAIYLDNHFRLLREDMLHEMKEEVLKASGQKKGHIRGFVVDDLKLLDELYSGDPNRRVKWGLRFKCSKDLPQFYKVKPKDRKKHLEDDPRILKHGVLACLIIDGQIVAMPTIHRDIDLLAQEPPTIVLQLEGKVSVRHALLRLKFAQSVRLVQVDTPIFAFEPVLKALQSIKELPFTEELLFWDKDKTVLPLQIPAASPYSRVVESFRRDPFQDLKDLLKTQGSIILDKSQASSLLAAFTQRFALIQGPPGTGKSFIGALLAKAIHDFTDKRIFVVCYTNHALDQFLEDLLDIGIPAESMVRLGGKSTTRTAPLGIRDQNFTGRKFGRADWTILDGMKATSETFCNSLETAFKRFYETNIGYAELLAHLEFEAEDFYSAFQVPESSDGFAQVGRRGRKVDEFYLVNQWSNGWDAGIFKNHGIVREHQHVWNMPATERQHLQSRWVEEILREHVEALADLAKHYNGARDDIDRKNAEKEIEILNSKRIVACTTTAAAKYSASIQGANPDVVLVEEAGEILESHIITSLAPKTSQIILIGDHKQLRPKVNHYGLTIERGDGYDLNRSVFERLVLKGYPHETLLKQHRMRPEISNLIRNLTYPDLEDAPKTLNRPKLRGVEDVLMWIDHTHPEDELKKLADRKDADSKSSKQNTHEKDMVLAILRYLAQQGYGTDQITILTPYLGQLQHLREALRTTHDPVLNDLDSHDLVAAGLLPAATASAGKKQIRLATIDNYQGEESEIIIASLTRSNNDRDIGFMFAPERLNVLLSRARNALILIGNSSTFTSAKKGSRLWQHLIELLRRGKHVYDGLPVFCERHPDRKKLLKSAADFKNECPDGGCQEPCTSKLKCGIHVCPSKCHQTVDHSQMPCDIIVKDQCPNGHDTSRKCSNPPLDSCLKCDADRRRAEKLQKEAYNLQVKRETDEKEHLATMAELDARIKLEHQRVRDSQLEEERKEAIKRKERELQEATSMANTAKKVAEAVLSQISRLVSSDESSTQQDIATSPITSANPPQDTAVSASSTTTSASASSQTVPSTPDSTTSTANSSTPDQVVSAPLIPPSPSEIEWGRQKSIEGAFDTSIEAIMQMTGLEDVKAQVLKIKGKIEIATRQGVSLAKERFNIVLLGNPGTGKTTVARHYAKFLASTGVLPGSTFFETTGARLANDGVPGAKKAVENVLNSGGGAFFVDEAYQLTSEHNFEGKKVLDFLLAEMENNVGKLIFILAGYTKEMEKFFEHNPGLRSRVPHELRFEDYTDTELLEMLLRSVQKRYNGRMKIAGGERGLYIQIAIRRLGSGRGKSGFGNARALENMFDKVTGRQAERITKERRLGNSPDDFLLTKEDWIGPDPSTTFVQSEAWKDLQTQIGLDSVKQSIINLVATIETNYKRELLLKPPVQMSLNRVFLGSPGTGKTTVAKLYGKILTELGLLSNGEVITKNPSDFVGNVLGASEANTKAILANTVGKVLIIDEAYMLWGGQKEGSGGTDSFKTAVIDTIVAEVQSVPGEDRCILLLGYKDQMEEMFQNVNPGLSRRFAIEDAFHFEDFTDSQLLAILERKLKIQDLGATKAAKDTAIDLLSRLRNRPNFGNGGEVENLLGRAKANYQSRMMKLPSKDRPVDMIFEPEDFDPDVDRTAHASENLQELFKDVIGCEEVIQKLERYQKMAHLLKLKGKDPRREIPTNYVFKGPPGTGKTTTARKMGQVYYDMGFLSSPDVQECSVSDLVGQYVGQTGPKTKKLLEKSLGRVLFVDEAYRLSEGHFAKEAIDELVSLLTQDKFIGKIVVILAGYDDDMNNLLSVNSGLASRFPEEIRFYNMSTDDCLQVLFGALKKADIDFSILEDTSLQFLQEVKDLIGQMMVMKGWGNARDIQTLAKEMSRAVYRTIDVTQAASDPSLILSGEDAVSCARAMLSSMQERAGGATKPKRPIKGDAQVFTPGPRTSGPPPSTSTKEAASKKSTPPPTSGEPAQSSAHEDEGRDAGVSDDAWRELQSAKKAEEEERQRLEDELKDRQKEVARAASKEANLRNQAKQLEDSIKRAKDDVARKEIERRLEEARLKEAQERARRAQLAAELQRRRDEEKRRQQEEARVQRKLQEMGVCVAGYRWIKIGSGYQCAGGSHFVSNLQLGI